MGFFSWKCTGCDNELINEYVATYLADEVDVAWLSYAVVVIPKSELRWCDSIDPDSQPGDCYIAEGQYDGYGNLDGVEMGELSTFRMFHKHCWLLLDSPSTWVEVSKFPPNGDAPNQGHFLDIADVKKMLPKPELLLY